MRRPAVLMRLRDVLTTRGRAFVAAGTTLALSGIVLGFADLTRIGSLLLVLPLLAWLAGRRTLPQVRVTRVVHPVPLQADQRALVEVELENTGARPTPLLLAQERVDYVLGDRPRFVMDRLGAGERRRVTYAVRSHVRGRHQVGPLRLRSRDPFGLTTTTLTTSERADVLVLPPVEPLGTSRPRGDGIGAEGSIPHVVALHGEDDVTIRGYREGDELRHIHWPATAHRGELMVRQEDRPARRRAVLLLDGRIDAHQGAGASASFEWAVKAAASIVVHLCTHGYAVHLLSSESVSEGWAGATVEADQALESLAVATLGHASLFEDVLHAASPLTSAGGLVVAVVTDHDEDVLRRIAALRQPGGTGLMMLQLASTYTGNPSAFMELASKRAHSRADILRNAGWNSVAVTAGDTVAGAWAAVTAASAVAAGALR